MLGPVEALLVIARTVSARSVASHCRAAKTHTPGEWSVGGCSGHAQNVFIFNGTLVDGIGAGRHAAAAHTEGRRIGRRCAREADCGDGKSSSLRVEAIVQLSAAPNGTGA